MVSIARQARPRRTAKFNFENFLSPAAAADSKSGFVCVMFYRRNAHVAELQMGTPANRLEDACAADHFEPSRLQFITLLGN